jgi:DNA-binding winged helix-turn-helix (wHTH) protein
MNDIQSSASRQVSFGPFRLLPYQRLLLQGDQQVFLGSRALDILTVLVERPGELVTRAELMSRAWPDTVVVPANLAVHVAALRRALGDGKEGQRYVVTVPGRGYRFVAPVAFTDGRTAAAQHEENGRSAYGLPTLFNRPPNPWCSGKAITRSCLISSTQARQAVHRLRSAQEGPRRRQGGQPLCPKTTANGRLLPRPNSILHQGHHLGGEAL